MNPKQVGFLGFDGAKASDLGLSADIFAAAALNDGYGNRIACYKIYTIGLSHDPFEADSGMIFMPDLTLREAPTLDTIVIPGGKGLLQPEITEKISDWILEHADRTRRIAALSTGIYGLAPTGLLDGREVTTDWRVARDVVRRFPKMRVDHRRSLVKDGAFYTSSGLSATMDLLLNFVEEDYGRSVALATMQEIVPLSASRSGQQVFSKPQVFDSQPADRFAELLAWIVRNLHEDLSINALARRACMSPSHFARAFKSVFGTTPAEFVENLRLNEAKRRLSVPKKTLDTIAASVGFSDRGAFRHAFERKFGARPRSYLSKLASNSPSILPNGKVASELIPAKEGLVIGHTK